VPGTHRAARQRGLQAVRTASRRWHSAVMVFRWVRTRWGGVIGPVAHWHRSTVWVPSPATVARISSPVARQPPETYFGCRAPGGRSEPQVPVGPRRAAGRLARQPGRLDRRGVDRGEQRWMNHCELASLASTNRPPGNSPAATLVRPGRPAWSAGYVRAAKAQMADRGFSL